MKFKYISMFVFLIFLTSCERQDSLIENCSISNAFSSQILNIEIPIECQNIFRYLNSAKVELDNSLQINWLTEFTIRMVFENKSIIVFKIDKEGFYSKNESSMETIGSVDLKYYEYIEKIYKSK